MNVLKVVNKVKKVARQEVGWKDRVNGNRVNWEKWGGGGGLSGGEGPQGDFWSGAWHSWKPASPRQDTTHSAELHTLVYSTHQLLKSFHTHRQQWHADFPLC